MQSFFKIVSVAFAVAGATQTANAGTITSFVGSVVIGGVVEVVLPNKSFSGQTSEGTHIFDGSAIDAFCIEATQSSSFPSTYTPTIIAQSSARYSLLNSLYSQYYVANKYSPVGAAALQATIWEIYEDPNNLNLATGNFILGAGTDAAVATLTSQMLQNIRVASVAPTWEFTEYISPNSQDLLTARRTGTVPLPASAALLIFGGLLLRIGRKAP
jgi:hypothetical protein